jgi:cold shock CspA family protein
MVCDRLRAAGVDAVSKGGPLSAYAQDSGTQDIYVADADLERARDALKEDQGVSEAELVQAEEEDAAGRRRTS